MRTRVVNLRHESYDVYCGRPGSGLDGPLGNPFWQGTREENIRQFETWFLERVQTDQDYRRLVLSCRGKRLGCFCDPDPCHCDVIARWLDSQPILEFSGPFFWLSNFSPSEFEWRGQRWPTVEHAFQAAKATTQEDFFYVAGQPSPSLAKRAGRAIACRSDWETVKVSMMAGLLNLKFQDPQLRALLLGTGDLELVEGNTWGDRFWGVYNDEGLNQLGELLMILRDRLRRG